MSTDLQTITLSTPGKDIESYLSCVHAIPILTAEQEQELAHKLYENNDLEASSACAFASKICGSYCSILSRLWFTSCRYYSGRQCWANESC